MARRHQSRRPVLSRRRAIAGMAVTAASGLTLACAAEQAGTAPPAAAAAKPPRLAEGEHLSTFRLFNPAGGERADALVRFGYAFPRGAVDPAVEHVGIVDADGRPLPRQQMNHAGTWWGMEDDGHTPAAGNGTLRVASFTARVPRLAPGDNTFHLVKRRGTPFAAAPPRSAADALRLLAGKDIRVHLAVYPYDRQPDTAREVVFSLSEALADRHRGAATAWTVAHGPCETVWRACCEGRLADDGSIDPRLRCVWYAAVLDDETVRVWPVPVNGHLDNAGQGHLRVRDRSPVNRLTAGGADTGFGPTRFGWIGGNTALTRHPNWVRSAGFFFVAEDGHPYRDRGRDDRCVFRPDLVYLHRATAIEHYGFLFDDRRDLRRAGVRLEPVADTRVDFTPERPVYRPGGIGPLDRVSTGGGGRYQGRHILPHWTVVAMLNPTEANARFNRLAAMHMAHAQMWFLDPDTHHHVRLRDTVYDDVGAWDGRLARSGGWGLPSARAVWTNQDYAAGPMEWDSAHERDGGLYWEALTSGEYPFIELCGHRCAQFILDAPAGDTLTPADDHPGHRTRGVQFFDRPATGRPADWRFYRTTLWGGAQLRQVGLRNILYPNCLHVLPDDYRGGRQFRDVITESYAYWKDLWETEYVGTPWEELGAWDLYMVASKPMEGGRWHAFFQHHLLAMGVLLAAKRKVPHARFMADRYVDRFVLGCSLPRAANAQGKDGDIAYCCSYNCEPRYWSWAALRQGRSAPGRYFAENPMATDWTDAVLHCAYGEQAGRGRALLDPGGGQGWPRDVARLVPQGAFSGLRGALWHQGEGGYGPGPDVPGYAPDGGFPTYVTEAPHFFLAAAKMAKDLGLPNGAAAYARMKAAGEEKGAIPDRPERWAEVPAHYIVDEHEVA